MRITRWNLLTLAAALLPLSAHAVDTPKEGTDTFTATWVATSPNTIQQGNRSFTSYELDGVTRNDAGGRMFHLFGQRCVGVIELAGTDRLADLGTCTFTDQDGNQIFMRYPVGKVADGHGTGELIGGTGKFAGITGTVDFTDTPPIKADDKAPRGAVLHKATWKLP